MVDARALPVARVVIMASLVTRTVSASAASACELSSVEEDAELQEDGSISSSWISVMVGRPTPPARALGWATEGQSHVLEDEVPSFADWAGKPNDRPVSGKFKPFSTVMSALSN